MDFQVAVPLPELILKTPPQFRPNSFSVTTAHNMNISFCPVQLLSLVLSFLPFYYLDTIHCLFTGLHCVRLLFPATLSSQCLRPAVLSSQRLWPATLSPDAYRTTPPLPPPPPWPTPGLCLSAAHASQGTPRP